MPWNLSRSLRMKLLMTVLAAGAFIFVYEGVIRDSRETRIESASNTEDPAPGRTVRFHVTAYCKGETKIGRAHV